MKPIFSVIIPSFNAREKLVLTLDSIRAQNFKSLEILVQDGNSGDSTQDFLAAQHDISWVSEVDNGIYDAMNRAIKRSSGRYLIFLGAGDTLVPDILKKVAGFLPAESGLNLLYGDALLTNGTRYDGPFSVTKLRSKNICHQAIFYERTLFESLGTYSLNYPLLADWEFNFRCFGNRKVQKTYLDLIVSEFEGDGRSRSQDEAFLYDRLALIRRHLGMRQVCLALIAKALPKGMRRRLKGNDCN